MALILTLDTATKNCSLALCDNGIILESIDHNKGSFSHSEKLLNFISELINSSEISLSDLNAVAVSMGPGSYTGLRRTLCELRKEAK